MGVPGGEACPPYYQGLYQRALICQTFPAYKLGDLRDSPDGRDIMLALEMLALAQKAQTPAK